MLACIALPSAVLGDAWYANATIPARARARLRKRRFPCPWMTPIDRPTVIEIATAVPTRRWLIAANMLLPYRVPKTPTMTPMPSPRRPRCWRQGLLRTMRTIAAGTKIIHAMVSGAATPRIVPARAMPMAGRTTPAARAAWTATPTRPPGESCGTGAACWPGTVCWPGVSLWAVGSGAVMPLLSRTARARARMCVGAGGPFSSRWPQ